jgi:hypothetical protein
MMREAVSSHGISFAHGLRAPVRRNRFTAIAVFDSLIESSLVLFQPLTVPAGNPARTNR